MKELNKLFDDIEFQYQNESKNIEHSVTSL